MARLRTKLDDALQTHNVGRLARAVGHQVNEPLPGGTLPLMVCLFHNWTEGVQWLLDHGADPSPGLHEVWQLDHQQMNRSPEALHDMVTRLLAAGAKPDADQLREALGKGVLMVPLLVAAGAPVGEVTDCLHRWAVGVRRELDLDRPIDAAQACHVVQVLCDHGADLLARHPGTEETVEAMLDRNAETSDSLIMVLDWWRSFVQRRTLQATLTSGQELARRTPRL